MKNKDKYELSGNDEDLSEKSIPKKSRQANYEKKVEKKDYQTKTTNSEYVIPNSIESTKTAKDYNKYDENTSNVDYNNYNTKEAIENGKDKSELNSAVLFCIIIVGAIIFVSILVGLTTFNEVKSNFYEIESSSMEKPIVQTHNNDASYTFNGETCVYKDISVELKENWLGEWAIFTTNRGVMDYGATEIIVVLYDKNNKIVDVISEYFSIVPVNHTVAASIHDDIPEFDRFEIFYDKKETEERTSYGIKYTVDGVEFSNIKENEYSISYDVKNISGEKIESIEYMVLLYNGDELVYFQEGYGSDIRKNSTEEDSIYLDDEIEYTEIDFIVNNIRLEE